MTPRAIRLIRSRPPPENRLKKSRTPPWVVLNKSASARGSMPGSGTKLSNRKTTSAPIVNHRRFLRSLARPSFARLRPALQDSALLAMVIDLDRERSAGGAKRPGPLSRNVHQRQQKQTNVIVPSKQ